MEPDRFDLAFDELTEQGFLEQVGTLPDGEPEYRLTAKAVDYGHRLEALKALEANHPDRIFGRRTCQD